MQECTWIDTNVFTVRGFLSAVECAEWIRRAEAEQFDIAPVNTSLGAVVRADIRNNDRVMFDDLSAANSLWERAAPYVPLRLGNRVAVGFNERLRFYRYSPGQFFDWHRDGYFERPNGERSLLTVLFYLNEDFTGGETSFEDLNVSPDRIVSVTPQTGLALFFEHPLLHKGEPVLTGHKYVLRTDVMYAAAS